MSVVDLRSDTLTQPTQAMRQAMACAEVGDDVYGEDPTVNRLQDRVAELLGQQAALFVPSGTMANQIAVAVQTRPGDEMLVGDKAHNWLYETGGTAAISGVQHKVLPGDGRFTAAAVRENCNPRDSQHPRTSLVSIENTHNMGGGLLWQPTAVDEVLATAKSLGLGTHLDGARLWNAASALASEESKLAAGFDTVAVSLSKGLGAPVGSVLAGKKDLIVQGQRVRKMLGGGMRQAGIIAAAGLYALQHHRSRLHSDHENARYLATGLANLNGLRINAKSVETNIVLAKVTAKAHRADDIVARAHQKGVRFSSFGEHIRLVTHLGINRADLHRALATIAAALAL